MSELETKAGASVGAAFEDFMRAFEAFKETNDERLDALERRSAADPLIEEELSRIDRALDEHRRTRIGGDTWEAPEVPVAEDFESYEVDILDGSTVKRTLASTTPSVTYTSAQQTADFGAAQPSYSVRVYQMSAAYGRGTARAATV